MAIIVTFDFPGAGQELYDTVIERVTGGQGFTRFADLGNPGLISHAAGPADGGFRVTEVWESEEALEAHAKTFGPILSDLGQADMQPTITPAHNVVVS
ncbi:MULTISPECIES: antibiotic biosynthesis monooxygenase [unclassified Streptomyces]|uniref:antibiotic biosynthesis monooxygenase n=1 Tax=unclassified Streptomyces TaxID=2593676 RepID=UPI002966C185|nr:antibiotic biosynthesis monooxygenase [Streptomyces sp. SJL17-1]